MNNLNISLPYPCAPITKSNQIDNEQLFIDNHKTENKTRCQKKSKDLFKRLEHPLS